MRIAISGSTGFVGKKAESFFRKSGHEVLPLGRDEISLDTDALAHYLAGSEVIIHLAGAPIIKRWTKTHREHIYNSRVLTTQHLVKAVEKMKTSPSLLMTASAVGIFPEEGIHSEKSKAFADNFLGQVCRDWEEAAAHAAGICRVVNLRFGVVLGRGGGALGKMMTPFRLGLGGKIGHGKQMMSWIHIEDVLGVMQFVIDHNNLHGPINLVSPQAVSNAAFTKVFASALRRPAILPIPPLLLKLALGDGAMVLTRGQTALPEKLISSGYEFRYPDLREALEEIVRSSNLH